MHQILKRKEKQRQLVVQSPDAMLKIHVCDHAQNVSDHDALPQSWKDRNGSGLRGLGIAER